MTPRISAAFAPADDASTAQITIAPDPMTERMAPPLFCSAAVDRDLDVLQACHDQIMDAMTKFRLRRRRALAKISL
ncbi:MAG TPA: hypothetical protein VMS82_10160 [Pseudolabrys sp.]|nr:hypothetical protein [Pseudolabrys sp.]